MNEKQKMQNHMLYDANYDAELLAERARAKDLCHAFNQLRPSETEKQVAAMKTLLGKTRGNFCIVAPFWCDYGYNIEIGENFFANHNTVILDGAKVVFGDNVFIAPNCGFHTAGHPIDSARRNQGLEYAHPIVVGDNVWFGAGDAGCQHRQQCGDRQRQRRDQRHSRQRGGGRRAVQGHPSDHRGGWEQPAPLQREAVTKRRVLNGTPTVYRRRLSRRHA